MLLQTQEGTQRQTDVVTLSTGGANLSAFHATILFDPTMIVFDGPGIAGETDSGQRRHVQIVRGPVFLVTVWGDDQEQADQTIAFQMDNGPVVQCC